MRCDAWVPDVSCRGGFCRSCGMGLEFGGYRRVADWYKRHGWLEWGGALLGNVKGCMESDYQRGSDKLMVEGVFEAPI